MAATAYPIHTRGLSDKFFSETLIHVTKLHISWFTVIQKLVSVVLDLISAWNVMIQILI
jgi:hypothetical protein